MSSKNPVSISFENIGKKYKLGSWQPGPLHRLRRRFSPASEDSRDFWALRNVSFHVRPGEVLGIIGHNGAGKSTILKILAGVTKPTTGSMNLNGRLSALIELGAGFHPELTGRDNVYLNGAILGLKKRQINGIFADIVDFAELDEFIDTPVKHYSSGMYARLGFSIAVHVDPDVLLVDEVLSVGDYVFQQKSLQRMLSFRKQAKAMIFVSHNLVAVQTICDKVIWLHEGQVRMLGKPSEVIRAYQYQRRKSPDAINMSDTKGSPEGIYIESVVLQDHSGAPVDKIRPDGVLVVIINLQSDSVKDNVTVAISIYQDSGMKCGETNNTLNDSSIPLRYGANTIIGHIPHIPLVPGRYYINVAISQQYLVQFDHISCAATFEITPLRDGAVLQGPVYFESRWNVAGSLHHESDKI